MRRVEKGEHPRDLVWRENQLRLQSHPEEARALFDQASARGTNKKLLEEQRHLCVFCERRIEKNPPSEPKKYDEEAEAFKAHGLRRAHWVPISKNPYGALDWRNVYASCNTKQTCDRRQGDRELGLRPPCDVDHSASLRCGSDGIYHVRPDSPLPPAERQALERALGESTLYLNHRTLVRARKAARAAAEDYIAAKMGPRHATREQREALAQKLLESPEHVSFISVYVQYLRK